MFVIREGEPPDALWVVVDGEVEVTIGGTFVRTMGPRSYFGEIGLLREIPRTASIRTLEPCTLWRCQATTSSTRCRRAPRARRCSPSRPGGSHAPHPHLVAETVAEESATGLVAAERAPGDA